MVARLRFSAPYRCLQSSGLGPIEWAVIVILGLLLFGRTLPDIGSCLGKEIAEFKKRIKEEGDDGDDDPGGAGVLARLKPKPPNLDGHAKPV